MAYFLPFSYLFKSSILVYFHFANDPNCWDRSTLPGKHKHKKKRKIKHYTLSNMVLIIVSSKKETLKTGEVRPGRNREGRNNLKKIK